MYRERVHSSQRQSLMTLNLINQRSAQSTFINIDNSDDETYACLSTTKEINTEMSKSQNFFHHYLQRGNAKQKMVTVYSEVDAVKQIKDHHNINQINRKECATHLWFMLEKRALGMYSFLIRAGMEAAVIIVK